MTAPQRGAKPASSADQQISKLLKSVDYMRGAKTVFGGALAAGFATLTGGTGLVLPALALSVLKGVVGAGLRGGHACAGRP